MVEICLMGGAALSKTELKWVMEVPIFRNSVILKQLGLAVGIPFGLVCIFLIVVGNGEIYALYGLGLVVALLALTYLFVLVVYGGKYQVGFTVDGKGILSYTLPRQAKRNKVINGLTVALGLISRNPSAAGAGALAAAKQFTYIPWKKIRSVKYIARQKVIIIRGGPTDRIALFCSGENYQLVEDMVHEKTGS